MTDMFAETVDIAPADVPLIIKFRDANRVNQVIEITIRDGTGTEFARQLQLDGDGYAESQFEIPAGWISVQLLESQSLQHSIAVSQ